QRRKGPGGPRRPGGGRGRPRGQDNVERPRTDEEATSEKGREQPQVQPEAPVVPDAVAEAPDTTTPKQQVEDPTKLEKSGEPEAARIAMTRKIRRGGKVWINVFPDKPVTQKPAETRMGSGKGAPEHWVAVVKPGRVMFELAGVDERLAKEALRLASRKLPIKTRVVKREADLFAS